MHRSPTGRLGGQAYAKSLANFNRGLISLIDQIQVIHPEVSLVTIDMWSFLNMVIDAPTTYAPTAGYSNTLDFCKAYSGHDEAKNAFREECGSRIDEYMWQDGFHPTYPFHEALAMEIAQTLDSHPARFHGPKLDYRGHNRPALENEGPQDWT